MIELDRFKLFALTLISHAALIYILFTGSLLQIASTVAMFMFITLVASTVTYHRLLSHRSWNAPRWFEIFGTLLGVLSFTGTPITRTAVHRAHHAYADTPKDPHSPRHLGALLTYLPTLQDVKLDLRSVVDLLRDSFHRRVHRWYLLIIAVTFATCATAFGPVWGIALTVAPGALCWMNVSICNICCHWGQEGDPIKSDRLLAILTFGEGWHRHHHEKPNDPDFGEGKFDPGYWLIKLLQKR